MVKEKLIDDSIKESPLSPLILSKPINQFIYFMKILHIVEPLATGILSFLVDLTYRQCDTDEVYIAYGIRPLTPKNFKELFDKRIHWIRVENFKMELGVHDVYAYKELKQIIKETNPDIVHCHSSISGFLGRMATDCKKRKVFYTPHGYSFLMRDGSPLKRTIYWLIEYLASKTHAITIACSEGEYKEARKLSKRCTYVNNGINVKELMPFITCRKEITPIVFTCGRILYQKNPNLFNEIARLLPEVRFIWIGEGEMKSVLTSPNIEITGWISRKEVLEISRKADFFLLPSLWEGLPISLLEAMCMKKICLVSNVIGNRDVIHDGINGYICNTASEYASRIRNILEKRIDPASLTEQALQDVLQYYNTEVMAEQYINIYKGQPVHN